MVWISKMVVVVALMILFLDRYPSHAQRSEATLFLKEFLEETAALNDEAGNENNGVINNSQPSSPSSSESRSRGFYNTGTAPLSFIGSSSSSSSSARGQSAIRRSMRRRVDSMAGQKLMIPSATSSSFRSNSKRFTSSESQKAKSSTSSSEGKGGNKKGTMKFARKMNKWQMMKPMSNSSSKGSDSRGSNNAASSSTRGPSKGYNSTPASKSSSNSKPSQVSPNGPSSIPSDSPSKVPSLVPMVPPERVPSSMPTFELGLKSPTGTPTNFPTTLLNTQSPTSNPTPIPSIRSTSAPSNSPTTTPPTVNRQCLPTVGPCLSTEEELADALATASENAVLGVCGSHTPIEIRSRLRSEQKGISFCCADDTKPCILQSTGQDMILESTGVNVELKDLIFRDGSNAGGDGGNVFIRGFGDPHRVVGCRFENGQSQRGGNLYVQTTGTLVVRDSVFVNGSAATIGGGLAVNRSVDVRILRSTFSENSAGEEGGGFYTTRLDQTGNTGQAISIEESSFEANAASVGGGYAISELGAMPELSILNTQFNDNSATELGGAGAFVEFLEGLTISFQSNSGSGNNDKSGTCPDFFVIDGGTGMTMCVAVGENFP